MRCFDCDKLRATLILREGVFAHRKCLPRQLKGAAGRAKCSSCRRWMARHVIPSTGLLRRPAPRSNVCVECGVLG